MKVNILEEKEKDPYSYNLLKSSWIQKAIRRNDLKTALALTKLYEKDSHQKALERKLFVIASEDIGLGARDSFIYLNKLDSLSKKVSFLCQQEKSRESDRLYYCFRNKKEMDRPEMKEFIELFDIAQRYVFNKRLKKNKDKLINKMKEINEKEYKIFFDAFSDCSKGKVHGLSNILSFFVLKKYRKGKDSNTEIKHSNNVTLDHLPKHVDDYALDMHTKHGKSLNRGKEHWFSVGAIVDKEYVDEKEKENDKFIFSYF